MSKTPQTTETTPSPPPPTEPAAARHVAMSTNMEVMACTLGFFFLCAILCAAFRLLYLKRLEHRRRNRLNRPVQFDFSGEERGPTVDNPVWLINFVGLSQSAIDSIAICKYKKGEGLIEGTECSVCLGEFEEDEDVRLLPKCSHAFHAPCIDTWLRSHKNCPLCRAPVVVVVGNVGEAVRMETLVEGSEAEVESESEVEARNRGDRVGEGGSGNEINMGFGDVMLLGGEIGGNSKICDSREIGGLVSEWEVDRSDRIGEGGSSTEIDLGLGDVMLIEGEIEGNSKNCDSREIGGLCNERELDRHNRGCGDRSGTEIDMGFSDVTLIEGNSKNYCSREIRGLSIEREFGCYNWVSGDDSGVEIDMSFGDVTQIDDEIRRNWKNCDFRAIGDLANKKMNLDHLSRVGEDGFGAEIDLSFGSNAQMDDMIGRNSKNLDSRAFSDLADKRMDLERRNLKNLVDFRSISDLVVDTRSIRIEPMKRSVSMGSNSIKLGKSKRNSFKSNGDGNRSSSLCRLIRSASSGRLSNRLPMKRCNSGSSGNFRSYDSILPL